MEITSSLRLERKNGNYYTLFRALDLRFRVGGGGLNCSHLRFFKVSQKDFINTIYSGLRSLQFITTTYY